MLIYKIQEAMKKNLYWVLVAMLVMTFAQGCDREYDLRSVDPVLEIALASKFPTAKWVEWEKNRGFYVAEFYDAGTEIHVWYKKDGEWCMTETDLGRNVSALPEMAQEYLAGGAYSNWGIDDIDKYERPGEVFYLVEVETSGKRDRDLYFSNDGTLIKDSEDRGDILPTTVL